MSNEVDIFIFRVRFSLAPNALLNETPTPLARYIHALVLFRCCTIQLCGSCVYAVYPPLLRLLRLRPLQQSAPGATDIVRGEPHRAAAAGLLACEGGKASCLPMDVADCEQCTLQMNRRDRSHLTLRAEIIIFV